MLPSFLRLRLSQTTRHLRHALQCRYYAEQSSPGEAQRTALVQGASRGLGLEFVKQLLDKPNQRYMLHGPPGSELSAAINLPHAQLLMSTDRLDSMQSSCNIVHGMQGDCNLPQP